MSCIYFFFFRQTALADNRLALAELLASLLEQQQARRKDLKHLLEEMEAQRQHQAADYWLVQYQRLIDSMPESVLANVEQLGKLNGHQRLKQEPSAPPMSLSDTFVNDVEPSAPTDVFAETTCVVCLDSLVSAQLFYLIPSLLCSMELLKNKYNIFFCRSVRVFSCRVVTSAHATNAPKRSISAPCAGRLFVKDSKFILNHFIIKAVAGAFNRTNSFPKLDSDCDFA